MRIQILGPTDLAFATLWITSCIIIHSFCYNHKIDIQKDWLKDGVQWEQAQKNDLGEEKKKEEKIAIKKQARKKNIT